MNREQYHTRAQLAFTCIFWDLTVIIMHRVSTFSTFRIIEVSFFVLSETFFNNILCAFFFYFSFSLLFHALSEQHFISVKHIPSIARYLLYYTWMNNCNLGILRSGSTSCNHQMAKKNLMNFGGDLLSFFLVQTLTNHIPVLSTKISIYGASSITFVTINAGVETGNFPVIA
ncbi:hypothetical protein ACJX0J_035695 [Zea mays]